MTSVQRALFDYYAEKLKIIETLRQAKSFLLISVQTACILGAKSMARCSVKRAAGPAMERQRGARACISKMGTAKEMIPLSHSPALKA